MQFVPIPIPRMRRQSFPLLVLSLCGAVLLAGLAGRSDFFVGSAFVVARWPLVIAATLLAWRLWRLGRRPAAVAGLVLAAIGAGEWAAVTWGRAEPGEPTSGHTLRVATHNVLFRGGDPEETLEALRRMDADVIALQEITPEWQGRLDRTFAAEYPHRRYSADRATDGYALLSRHPLGEVDLVEARPGYTIAQCAEVRPPHAPVYLCNVHLSSPARAIWKRSLSRMARNAVERRAEWTRLEEFLETHATSPRRIVAGDLNTLPVDPLYRRITGGWVDSFRFRAGPAAEATGSEGRPGWTATRISGFGGTWPHRHEDLPTMFRIDYVLVQGPVRPAGTVVGPAGGSDHLPVTTTLQL